MAADTTHVAELANATEAKRQGEPASAKMALLSDSAELFRDPTGRTWATVPVDGHLETYRLDGKAFRMWLVSRYYRSEGTPPKSQTIQDALAVLEARARFEGPIQHVYLRLADYQDHIYLDLGDPSWRAVEIGDDGWRVVQHPPVKFRRPYGLQPLPEPVPGGSLADLTEFIHVDNRETFILAVAWLIGAFRPHGPYPVLAVEGGEGAGKSTACRMLRDLIDPNAAGLRHKQRDERDLFISASNSWVVAYDNLSGASDGLSDALCMLSTGGGFAARKLYEDQDEVILQVQRPVMLNGIESIARRADLRDRTVRVLLAQFDESGPLDEATLRERFELARPGLLGALCDAVSAALRNWAGTKLDKVPRLADFARWITAAEEALPWGQGTFMQVYLRQLDALAVESLEGDPIAQAVMDLVAGPNATWTGTASELHALLSRRISGAERVRLERASSWPATPQTLSNWLRRMAHDLRRGASIDIRFRRQGHDRTRTIILSRLSPESHASATTSM